MVSSDKPGPITGLAFEPPADHSSFPAGVLPIAMQRAVGDRQRELVKVRSPIVEARRDRVALCVTDAWDCLVTAIAAHTLDCDIFFWNPHWSPAEQTAAGEIVRPTVIVRDRARSGPHLTGAKKNVVNNATNNAVQNTVVIDRQVTDTPIAAVSNHDRPPYWAIPTGGTSGQIRFACHTWQTLAASAVGVRAFFQRDRLNSFCCLPMFHVSGLSQFVRAIVSGGRLTLAAPAALRPEHVPPAGSFQDSWLSLVPTQLQRLLDRPGWRAWLQQFEVIFLGGAPAWTELLDHARSQGLRLAPTFGMTETASQVATLHPDAFLAGRSGCGCVLPHAQLTIAPDTGSIAIAARSLFHGYYDATIEAARPFPSPWLSDDRGYIDGHGNLHITGRASRAIVTGGENVSPEEIETAIRATGLVRDVAVVGIADREWGQVVAVAYVPLAGTIRVDDRLDNTVAQPLDRQIDIDNQLRDRLARHKLPKRWQALEQLPRNDRGKLDYAALRSVFTPPEPRSLPSRTQKK